jgi:pyruvate dehydrogenase E1 component beta subunit
VLVFEYKNLLGLKGSIGSGPCRLGVATLARPGRDVTVVATQQMRHRAAEAADQLAGEGIEVEIIDPRTLVPFDDEAVAESHARTARLLVVQEGPPNGSWGGPLVARMTMKHFDCFDAPPKLLAAAETPIPYPACLEEAWMPQCKDVIVAARDLVAL